MDNPSRPSLVRVLRDPDREADRRPLDPRLIRRLFGYMRPYAARRNVLLVCVVLRATQLPAVAWATGLVVNGPIARREGLVAIAMASLVVLVLGAATHVTFHFRYRLALELGEFVIHDLRDDLFRQLQRLPLGFFHRTKIGRIISRMTSDCEAMRVGVQDVLFVGLVGLGQMAASAAFMAWYDWALFSIIAAMTPVLWGLNQHFRKRLSQAYRDVQESFSRMTATLAESVAGIRVTQGYARERVNASMFADLVADHARYNMAAVRTAGVFTPLLEFNSQAFLAALLVVGGYRALRPDIAMPTGDLIQFFFLAGIFFNPIQILGVQYNQALTAMAGAERVFRLLDTAPDWRDAADARDLPTLAGRVEFRDVSFSYTPGTPVLKNIDFVAEPGRTVALVGHTGSGKSSLVNLLARFYLPDSGELRFDGHETRGVVNASLQRQLGLVPQQNFLFTGTILDNIRFSRPEASEADVWAALEQLDCRDLFAALPDGLHTEAGERGGQLSLGQRQLVCFARALLADPRILILDEATSAIDSLTELRIQRALERLVKGRTSFVVAHRLSTIRRADLVLVLDDGRIVERGNHESLLAEDGHYAALWRANELTGFGDNATRSTATENAPGEAPILRKSL